MLTPLLYTAVVTLLFVGYLVVVVAEEKRGRRFFLATMRDAGDSLLDSLVYRVQHMVRYVTKYVITLSWYYSLHAFLKLVLQSLAGIYHMLEAILIKNRDRARLLRKEKRTSVSHLAQIAEHKEEVRLTPTEARKRKEKALKGR